MDPQQPQSHETPQSQATEGAIARLQDRVAGLSLEVEVERERVNKLVAVQGELTAAKEAITQLQDKLDQANVRIEAGRVGLDSQAVRLDGLTLIADRFKDALGFLAEKLQKETPGHPRQGLYSGVMRILDGKPVDPEPAQTETTTTPVTQTSE